MTYYITCDIEWFISCYATCHITSYTICDAFRFHQIFCHCIDAGWRESVSVRFIIYCVTYYSCISCWIICILKLCRPNPIWPIFRSTRSETTESLASVLYSRFLQLQYANLVYSDSAKIFWKWILARRDHIEPRPLRSSGRSIFRSAGSLEYFLQKIVISKIRPTILQPQCWWRTILNIVTFFESQE